MVVARISALKDIQSTTKSAKIHGVVTELTQMDSQSKYFEGRIADEKTTMRVVGFEKRQRDQLAVQKDLKQPVELHNCVIQKERRGDGMEVVISGSTKISTSPRKYKDIAFRKPPEKCTVSQIKDKDDSELTTLMVKVLKFSTKQEVKSGLFKEDVMIGDTSGNKDNMAK